MHFILKIKGLQVGLGFPLGAVVWIFLINVLKGEGVGRGIFLSEGKV